MKLSAMAAFAVMSAVLTVPANAHHSFNTFFDMSRTIAIEGVVASARQRWETHFSPDAGRARLAVLLRDLDLRS